MSLPDPTPNLPKLPFFIGDAVLLAAAWYLARHSEAPLSAPTVAAIAVCVALGAILAIIPFLVTYTRQRDAALDERQNSLEALTRTLTASAEQISIVASGLHQITEIAQKNLKHAEQLPQKLQEKIAEFNAQLDSARDSDREELEKELAELRASETDRLQATSAKIHQAVAELTKLEAATQKQINARTDLNEAASAAAREFAAAHQRALADIDSRLKESTATALATIQSALHLHAAATAPLSAAAPAESAPLATLSPVVSSPPKRPRKARPDESSVNETPTLPEPLAETPPPPPVSDVPPAFTAPDEIVQPPEEPAPIPTESIQKIEPVAPVSADPFRGERPEPTAEISAPPTTPPDVAAPAAPEPAISTPPDQPPTSTPAVESPSPEPAVPPPPERPTRKRSPKKNPTPPEPTSTDSPAEPGPSTEPPVESTSPTEATPVAEPPPSADNSAQEFTLTAEDESVASDDAIERVISSDGATRLIATAYIGIGNRLFIRGDGPGLSWEKGIPLQFISIGKWRWETAEATAPVNFKLYKNDDTECTALGALVLDPGYQQEVTARF